ncbi:hypothetical protein GV828_11320 [Flavobacterium sp. NST-5]|uniref:O-antigen ligase-related domain-containing protein n=1 Tax=Flavobacterium ichthyis TaxID=2698827 RepID=A0ABW9ZFC0_9FLAO|nr:O-antigen ligase family protein [Flavobacterium ichthyis]NBL65790.1 hypothetical protein [Flavobacterium ichthyis]
MSNIYNFFTNPINDFKDNSKKHASFLPFLALVVSIPISLALNNVFLVLFFLSAFLFVNKTKPNFSLVLILPMLLFIWMGLSYFWSIDTQETLKAIPKEIAFVLIPLAFAIIPRFTVNQKDTIVKYYSYTILLFVIYYIIRAFVRYFTTGETTVFFYHGPNNETDTGLVPRLLNAIHVSVFVALAFFYFFTKKNRTQKDIVASILMFVFIMLLSSKNIIIVFIILLLINIFFFSNIGNKLRLRNLTIILLLLGAILSIGKIKERFLIEFRSNSSKSLSHNVNTTNTTGVNNISIYEAWNNEHFTYNDFLPGTSFRVYQFRMFTEFLKEEPIFWKGFGLNASKTKLQAKEKQYNLYPGYGSFNFHNQYVQNFAELGIIGFILLMFILIINIKNAVKTKDFIHIAFAILMLTLFITESFLWRQRGATFFIVFYCLLNTYHSIQPKVTHD